MLDKLTVKLDDIYQTIDQSRATTAVPSANQIQRLFSFLTSHYQSIIVITISSKLSSMYQHLCMQANKFNDVKISVIDSLRSAGTHGLLVMKAAKLIKAKLSHDEIIEKLHNAIEQSNIFVSVGNFETLQKSGRIPRVVTKFISYMQFKPIIGMDKKGHIKIVKVLFGQERSFNELVNIAILQIKQINNFVYCIIHSQEHTLAHNIADTMKASVGKSPLYIQEVSTSIGIHVGKGCVAIAYMQDQEGLFA